MKHIMICRSCKVYTMKQFCPKCSSKTDNPKPPKWSPDDKFGAYRRKAKKLIMTSLLNV